jgi:hypothetical protein
MTPTDDDSEEKGWNPLLVARAVLPDFVWMVFFRLYILTQTHPAERRELLARMEESEERLRVVEEALREYPDGREALRQVARGFVIAGLLLVGIAYWWRYSDKGYELRKEIAMPGEVVQKGQ